jgi:hypothetical protein
MQIFVVRRQGDRDPLSSCWTVLAATAREAIDIVRHDRLTNPDWQLVVGESTPTSAEGDPHIISRPHLYPR